ncbi:MAG TPA: ChbG/HpnK family deacetylase [Candidatus Paceibacterota bacterium]
MRRLIVNADDFGWSESVNRGIIDCYRYGIVTSTSLLATGFAFDGAISLAKQNPGLKIGVHLNFYRGEPLLPESGRLPESVPRFVLGMLAGKSKLEIIEREFRAQIEKVKIAGLKISHLNSEKHLHHWPSIFELVCRLASEYKIPYVRLVRERFSLNSVSVVLTLFSNYNAKVLSKYGLTGADRTIGVSECPADLVALERLLKGVKDNTTEFIVHPGYLDDEFWQLQKNVNNKLTYSRKAEMITLSSVEARKLIQKYEISLNRNTA